MERKLFAVLVCFGLGCGRASAQAGKGSFFTTADTLAAQCRIDLRAMDTAVQASTPDLMIAQSCFGYVTGTLDAFEFYRVAGQGLYQGQSVCIPDDVRSTQAIRVFMKYADEHPEELHLAASLVLWDAMHQAFPCAGK